MDGQPAAVHDICLIIQLLKQLGVEHTHDEIEGAVVVRDHGINGRFLLAQAPQLHLIVLRDTGQRIQVELLQPGDQGDLDGFQGFDFVSLLRATLLCQQIHMI